MNVAIQRITSINALTHQVHVIVAFLVSEILGMHLLDSTEVFFLFYLVCKVIAKTFSLHKNIFNLQTISSFTQRRN